MKEKKRFARDRLSILVDYIKQERAAGYSARQIKKKLLEAGYREEGVEKVFRRFGFRKKESLWGKIVKLEHEVEEEAHQIWDSVEHKMHNRMVLFYLGLIVLMLIIGLISVMMVTVSKDCGADADCFFAVADSCGGASLILDSFDTLILIESSGQCTLTKTIIDLDPSEPVAVQNLFMGRSMVCSYERGSLPPEMVLSLREGLADCEGPLKEAIYQVLIAMYGISEEKFLP